jgi:hypothetical protein
VAVVARLLTLVDIGDGDDDGPDAPRMSLSARHEAILTDGRRVPLLVDRGWSAQQGGGDELRANWAFGTVEEIKRTARDVVGPDEPSGERTQADVEASHWEHLAGILRRHGVAAEADELKALPHDVELSDRVLERA